MERIRAVVFRVEERGEVEDLPNSYNELVQIIGYPFVTTQINHYGLSILHAASQHDEKLPVNKTFNGQEFRGNIIVANFDYESMTSDVRGYRSLENKEVGYVLYEMFQ